jgi:molybdopterin-guanine dinucleotide biosynthesis protein A
VRFQGIVLAGGKSSRFGEDKALALVDGIPIIQRALSLLIELHFDPCVITSDQRDYSFLSCPVEKDLIPLKGPLGGLYTACSLFPETSLLILTCDMPLLTGEVLKQLMRSHRNSDQVTVFSLNQKLQPFPGIYEADLKTIIYNCLVSDKLSMKLFLSHILNKRVVPESSGPKAFQNVNRQEDLELITDWRKSGAVIKQ